MRKKLLEMENLKTALNKYERNNQFHELSQIYFLKCKRKNYPSVTDLIRAFYKEKDFQFINYELRDEPKTNMSFYQDCNLRNLEYGKAKKEDLNRAKSLIFPGFDRSMKNSILDSNPDFIINFCNEIINNLFIANIQEISKSLVESVINRIYHHIKI